jgi:hypothetical protein
MSRIVIVIPSSQTYISYLNCIGVGLVIFGPPMTCLKLVSCIDYELRYLFFMLNIRTWRQMLYVGRRTDRGSQVDCFMMLLYLFYWARRRSDIWELLLGGNKHWLVDNEAREAPNELINTGENRICTLTLWKKNLFSTIFKNGVPSWHKIYCFRYNLLNMLRKITVPLFRLSCQYFTTASRHLDSVTLNGRITHEWRVGRDSRGNGSGLISVLRYWGKPWNLSGYVSRPRFQPTTSWIQVWRVMAKQPRRLCFSLKIMRKK